MLIVHRGRHAHKTREANRHARMLVKKRRCQPLFGLAVCVARTLTELLRADPEVQQLGYILAVCDARQVMVLCFPLTCLAGAPPFAAHVGLLATGVCVMPVSRLPALCPRRQCQEIKGTWAQRQYCKIHAGAEFSHEERMATQQACANIALGADPSSSSRELRTCFPALLAVAAFGAQTVFLDKRRNVVEDIL